MVKDVVGSIMTRMIGQDEKRRVMIQDIMRAVQLKDYIATIWIDHRKGLIFFAIPNEPDLLWEFVHSLKSDGRTTFEVSEQPEKRRNAAFLLPFE